jgi:polysaccharide export outer membrane protein
MKKRSDHLGLGLVLTVLTGSLWAQVPDARVPGAATSLAELTTTPHDASFIIGNDDLLAINVWKEPELTRSIPVRLDGRISLPLVGEVQAAGRTPLQLEHDIATKLRNYIDQPEVTVMIEKINSQKFNVLGQVMNPGSYSLTLATTVLDGIAAAGGFRDFAKQKDIYVLRQDSSGGQSRIAFNYKEIIKGKHLEQNIKLEPRDTIVVP